MKKRALSIALALALVLGLGGAAGAELEDNAAPAVECNVDIQYVLIPASSGIFPTGPGRDGMFSCYHSLSYDALEEPYGQSAEYVYVSIAGYTLHLNGSVGFQFSDGLVPVMNKQYKVGYADNTGRLVIPYQFDPCLVDGQLCLGRFENGRCPVYFKTGETDGTNMWYHLGLSAYPRSYDREGKSTQGTWKTIDRQGNIVSETAELLQVETANTVCPLDYPGYAKAEQEALRWYSQNYPYGLHLTLGGERVEPVIDKNYGYYTPGGEYSEEGAGRDSWSIVFALPLKSSNAGKGATGSELSVRGQKVEEEPPHNYTGPRPVYTAVRESDVNDYLEGKVVNDTDEILYGRWGILVACKYNDGTGKWTPRDLNIVEYAVEPHTTCRIGTPCYAEIGGI